MYTFFLRFALLLNSALLLIGCSQGFEAQNYRDIGANYEVTIERDNRGVPHILGERNTDTAFGFAWAQAEDNWALIEDAIPFYRGTSAKYRGREGAATDFLVKWLGIWETLDANYESQLSVFTRAYVEAYADGLNYYAALHPQDINPDILPITGKDVVASYMLRHLLFYGFDSVITELTASERQRPVSQPGGVSMGGLPVGSNAFAVAPRFSEDGATRLAINSHQPTTGPVAWYEAHIQSNEGMNIMGGLFPGSPTISVGFTPDLAWGVTVNKPDLVDIYVLDIDPEDPMRYRLDGEWHTLESRDVDIEISFFGFLPWTVTEQALASEHGPVLRTGHGTYAVRYAGMGELRQVEQWLAMNQANNFEEWRDAMRIHAFSSFNFVYADRDGNIMFVHNSQTPVRPPGHDWSLYLPGDDSSLIWQEYMAFDDLPQVINPESGFVHSANQNPFRVTNGSSNPNPANFRPEDGFPTRMTNRADRGLELIEQLGPLSEGEFFAIKHDKQYAANSRAAAYIGSALRLKLDASVSQRYVDAQALLRGWNLSTEKDNRGAALGACLIGAEWLAEQKGRPVPEVWGELRRCTDMLLEVVGRLDPPWGEVNRHVRGTVNLPVGGGPDTLRAIYGEGIEEDGFHTNVAGDGLYYLVSWSAKGDQKVRGVHQFGSATLDVTSPHYADQAEDYANEVLHDPLFNARDRKPHVRRRYHPGATTGVLP